MVPRFPEHHTAHVSLPYAIDRTACEPVPEPDLGVERRRRWLR